MYTVFEKWHGKFIGISSPGGFVEEHDRRVAEKFLAYGEPFPFASG